MELTHRPDPDEETPYRPLGRDVDTHAEAIMRQGKVDDHDGNDLRDPWFHTQPGQAWLADHEED